MGEKCIGSRVLLAFTPGLGLAFCKMPGVEADDAVGAAGGMLVTEADVEDAIERLR